MSEKKHDQEIDLVAEDITVEELQNEQVVEDVEVSEQEETIAEEVTSEEADADTVEEAADAEKEVNGEKANDETIASIKKSASKQATPPKTKAGLINASYKAMSQMTKEQLTAFYDSLVNIQEEISEDESEVAADEVVAEETQVEVKVDFQEDLNALVSEQSDLSEDFKDKAAVIFEAAVKSKISAEIDRLEEQYKT